MSSHCCGYRNGSDRMVILRCLGPEAFYLERVIFPFELLSFACPPQSQVEIWTHGMGGALLQERIPARQLLLEPSALEVVPGASDAGDDWREAG